MATLSGGQHTADGTAEAVSDLVSATRCKQLDIKANSGNAAVVYVGPSTVTAAGVNAWIALEAGKSWGFTVESSGSSIALDLDDVYVIGTASDKAHIVVVL